MENISIISIHFEFDEFQKIKNALFDATHPGMAEKPIDVDALLWKLKDAFFEANAVAECDALSPTGGV